MAGEVEFGFVASAADAPGTPDHELYRTVLEDVEFHADLGYTTAWLIEHHFSDYFPTPSPLILASHIAARFPELSLGTCVLVTPWYQPLRLAGEIAMLSLLTEQPLHLGLGRGTAKYEFDAFGVDMQESRQRFEEAYEILTLALSGEAFTYQGTYLQVPKQADPPVRRHRQPGQRGGHGQARPPAHLHDDRRLRHAGRDPARLGQRRGRERYAGRQYDQADHDQLHRGRHR
jgi:alkanesulfonate monooxygenase SsuD/methylene tetrahydromethanopterin reductase-like flavin-dependent oxidoreductase (luciferase family)